MSLNFQLQFEPRPRFVTVWRKRVFFLIAVFSFVFPGDTQRDLTQRDLSKVLHLSLGDAQHKTAPQHPKRLCLPGTSQPDFEMDSPPLGQQLTLRPEQGLLRSVMPHG